jgi:uncharacterized protein
MSAPPIEERERIASLDVMRGFAVLGILAVNAVYFAAPWQTAVNPALAPLTVTDATLPAWLAMHVVFEAKCITLFSLLFGVSIYLVGGENGDPVRGPILLRRLLWLAVFGAAHALLLWSGDILLTYALAGLAAARMRSWPAHRLLSVGIGVFATSVLLSALGHVGLASAPQTWPAEDVRDLIQNYWAPGSQEIARQIAAYRSGIAGAFSENASEWFVYLQYGLAGLVIRSGALMLIGMGLFKLGFLSGRAPMWTYLLMLALGAGAFALIARQALANYAHGFDFVYMHRSGMLANDALAIFGSLFYASLFVLLVRFGARIVTTPLAAVGRMAFTNYLTQSLIMTTIFWGGRGFGLFGEVDRAGLWAIVVAIWAAQLIWSPLWLSRFKMGPLEWVWRRLSYGAPFAITKGKTG